MRVGVFGGSFNPPHVAHVLAITYALSVGPLDRVLVVPVFRHPFAKDLTPYEHRLAMCQLAFGWLPRVDVSTVERELGGESLTLKTLEHLAQAHPEWRMRLIVGSDVLPDLPRWHRFDRVAELAEPLVIQRSGAAPVADAAGRSPASAAARPLLPELSSTEVRELFALRDHAALGALVPREVVAYATEHGLYPGRGSAQDEPSAAPRPGSE